MRKTLTLLIVLILNFTIIQTAKAGWWIFGQGSDGINIDYLYINKNSYDETSQNIKFYNESLKDGKIQITGKASVYKGDIGDVFISTDNMANWQIAEISDNGAFNFSFTPEIDKEYDLYIKIIDTRGKTNEIEDTYRKVVVVNENIRAAVSEVLNAAIKAYEAEDAILFMSYISPDFAGDEMVLDNAVRRDFTAFDYIQIQPFINNVSSDSTGRVFVSLSYLRTAGSTKSGQTFTDKGNTEIVFKNEDGKLKIFSMKNPLLFGLSDAGEVATGVIQSSSNDPILVVGCSGEVDTKPLIKAIEEAEEQASSGGIIEGTIVIKNGIETYVEGYEFLADSRNFFGELAIPMGAWARPEIGTIDTITTATVQPNDANIIAIFSGLTYSVLMPDGTYMLVYCFNTPSGTSMRYKYQPNGTNKF